MRFDTTALATGDKQGFAATNELHWQVATAAPRFDGAVFQFLQGATATDRFTHDGRLMFEAGNIAGNVDATYGGTRYREYGYVAMQLARPVPQLVLDAASNEGLFGSSIPMPIAGGQPLSLAGKLDDHVTLYAPAGYEADALHVFTPDLMALLIDKSGGFDVEVVDDMLFVYSNRPFDFTDAGLWIRLGYIHDVVGAKPLAKTDYYEDDRVADREADVVPGAKRTRQPDDEGPSTRRFGLTVVAVFGGVIIVIGAIAIAVLVAVRGALGL